MINTFEASLQAIRQRLEALKRPLAMSMFLTKDHLIGALTDNTLLLTTDIERLLKVIDKLREQRDSELEDNTAHLPDEMIGSYREKAKNDLNAVLARIMESGE